MNNQRTFLRIADELDGVARSIPDYFPEVTALGATSVLDRHSHF
jgi:hypothetical protein